MDINGSKRQKNLSLPIQDWADWLSNDGPAPAAKEELRKQRVKQAGIYTPRGFGSQSMMAATPANGAEVKSVVINLHLPKLRSLTSAAVNLNKLKSVKLSRRRVGIAAAVVVVLFLVKLNPSPAPKTQTNTAAPAVVKAAETTSQSQINPVNTTNLATGGKSSMVQPQTTSAPVSSASASQTSPSFIPVVPASEPQLKNPTFARTSYDSNTNVYTIVDSFGGGPVTINETAAPAGSSAQSIAQKNASQISQPQTIKLPSGEAYLTAPTSSGQQTAVLAVGNVIVFVNSKIAHSLSDWQTYLENLG